MFLKFDVVFPIKLKFVELYKHWKSFEFQIENPKMNYALFTWQSGRNNDHAANWPDFCVYFFPNIQIKPQKLLLPKIILKGKKILFNLCFS